MEVPMARRPTTWPKGRPRLKIANQNGFRRSMAGKSHGWYGLEVFVLYPILEEWVFRGSVLLFVVYGGWQSAIIPAIISMVAFTGLHWRMHAGDVVDYVQTLPVYLILSIITSAIIIIWPTWLGMAGAIAWHAWNNIRVEIDEYCQRRFRFSPFGWLNTAVQKKIKKL